MIANCGVLLLVLFMLGSVQMVTLEEAMQDPARFIRYEMSSFNVGLNALFALLMLSGMLAAIVTFIALVSRSLGYRKKRQS
ncbi:unnamed protein product [Echinostoma caproni]|uniref:Inner membrane protein n=1 Tax=Echinostoma caproni TaxID=27848 RepID=A0A183AFH2_9TREM|nr:unnamed protein product [Echinostoma caproni]